MKFQVDMRKLEATGECRMDRTGWRTCVYNMYAVLTLISVRRTFHTFLLTTITIIILPFLALFLNPPYHITSHNISLSLIPPSVLDPHNIPPDRILSWHRSVESNPTPRSLHVRSRCFAYVLRCLIAQYLASRPLPRRAGK